MQEATHRLQFNAEKDEYRIGTLPNTSWALLAVQGLDYLYAWEAPDLSQPYAQINRRSGPLKYLKLLNPISPFSPEYGKQLLDDLLEGISPLEVHNRLNQQRIEVERRRSQLEADITRYHRRFRHT